jgi:hypothetical protein
MIVKKCNGDHYHRVPRENVDIVGFVAKYEEMTEL